MANWKSKIDLSDLRNQYDNNEITLSQLSSNIATRLSASTFVKDESFVDIIDEFKSLSESSDPNEDDFDNVLSELYDFGDDGNSIFVNF
jgi:hypothetical protein